MNRAIIRKSRRKNNASLTAEEQQELREITMPYGCLTYASDKTGISTNTISSIIKNGTGRADSIDKLRQFIAESKLEEGAKDEKAPSETVP